MGAAAGLYSVIAVGFFASVFGGTRSQISGPTGPMTIAMAVIITTHASTLPEALTVVIMGGLLQILLGLLRVGRFVEYTPYVVISGFMTGAVRPAQGIQLELPTLGFLPSAVEPAIILALLGSVDSLLTSLVADSLTGTRHNPNRELVGQGIGNVIAGMFGGLPGGRGYHGHRDQHSPPVERRRCRVHFSP